MKPVLVAGAGYVGLSLAAHLAAGGREVWALRRSAMALPDGVRPLVVDLSLLSARPSESSAIDGERLDVCFLVSPDGPDQAAYRRAYLEALAAVGERASIARLLFASSTAVYGGARGWVDEDTSCTPETFSGKVLLEAEALARDIGEQTVVLRFGGIYGPGRDRMLRRVADGFRIASGEGSYGNRIHRDDAALAMAHLLALEAPAPCYAVVDDDPADLTVVEAWIAERLGVDRERLRAAPPRQRGGQRRVCNARLRASGYALRYPTFREGYEALLTGFR